ncbi:hypothetical protein niasHS_000876 [Heterodera schachtii]|uniref:Uncharacterized protein n=1 Tax=Heterodera schachtii TaxID=97005 RepID=A0ABD2KLQ8_HETSC
MPHCNSISRHYAPRCSADINVASAKGRCSIELRIFHQRGRISGMLRPYGIRICVDGNGRTARLLPNNGRLPPNCACMYLQAKLKKTRDEQQTANTIAFRDITHHAVLLTYQCGICKGALFHQTADFSSTGKDIQVASLCRLVRLQPFYVEQTATLIKRHQLVDQTYAITTDVICS